MHLKVPFFLAATAFALLSPSQARAQSLTPPTNPPASPGDMVHALHAAFGAHHARAVHTKGILLEGEFTPDEQASTLTKASFLQKEPCRVLARFSDFTGLPDIPDNNPLGTPRGLAIKYLLPGGGSSDMVCHSFNGFPTATSEEFRLLLISIGASGPTATKPTALDYFLDTHPVTKTFLTTQRFPVSWATTPYFGVNSFKMTNRRGESRYVRYQFAPTAGEHFFTAEEFAGQDANYMANEIKARIARETFGFQLYAQIADRSDNVENPSVAWPDTRRRVSLGTIKIERLAANTPEEDRAAVFNPGNLPEGIEMADEMVKLRAAAYPISVKERR